MAPAVYCVRHAQGYHNLTVQNHSLHDPDLTELGKEQCSQLQKDFPHHDKIDLIVASPIRRTIYTALLSFHDTIQQKGLKVIALPELQETSDLPCDTGSEKEKLEKEFANEPVDLSLVNEGWNIKRGRWAPSPQALQNRARIARQWLKNRPEKNIVIVTHGGFLHYFTKDWDEFEKFAGTGWPNTEFRWYYYKRADGETDEEADIEEYPESKTRRRGQDNSLDQEEVTNLERTVSARNSLPQESTANGSSSGPASCPNQQAPLGINTQAAEQRPQVIQAKV